MLRKERIENVAKKRRTKPFSLDLAWWNNNIQRRCSLDLVSPNNDTNRVDANKRKVCYKKRNPILTWPRPNNNCTNPYTWTEYVKKQNYITKKENLPLFDLVRPNNDMYANPNKELRGDIFFLAHSKETWSRRRNFFSQKASSLDLVRPNNQLMLGTRTRESISRPILRAEQKGPDFLKCSLKKDSQISNLWRKCLRFFL